MENYKALAGEVWKEYNEGLYISNYGRVVNDIGKGDKFNPHFVNGTNSNGYLQIKYKGKIYSIHRLVGLLFIPNPENKPEVDHINSPDKLNNIIGNLRWATRQEQNINRKTYGKSGHKNIRLRKNGSFEVQIRRNKKYVVDKTFKKLKDAIEYRDIKLKELDKNLFK